MVSSECKSELLKELIQMIDNKQGQDVVNRKLYDLLMLDTNGTGKLYKFRSFDANGYNLNGLSNGTMWCSRPNDFNDPFDSKLGISFDEIFNVKYSPDLKLIDSMFGHLILIAKGQIDLEDCPESERQTIKAVLENPNMAEFLNKFKQTNENEKAEIAEHVFNNIPLVLNMMSTILSNDSISSELHISSDMLLKPFDGIDGNAMRDLCKSDFSLKAFSRAHAIDVDGDEFDLVSALVDKCVSHGNQAAELNQKTDELYNSINDMMNNFAYLGCLATDYKNRLMWSHYSINHTGFCVEHNFDLSNEESLIQMPFPVVYSKKRPQIPWRAAIEQTPEAFKEAQNQILLSLLTKDDVWSYEKEWRLLIPINGNQNHVMPKITCIYLGLAISEENKKAIIEIAKEKNIPVKQMVMDRSTYELHAKDIGY